MAATPVHDAATCGDVQALARLLASSPAAALSLDDAGCMPLHSAAAAGDLACVRLLAQAAPAAARVCNGDGDTPVAMAIRGHAVGDRLLAIVDTLLAVAPQAAHLADVDGCTLLHAAAASYAPPPVIERLLHAAPGVATVLDNNGESPLHIAAVQGDVALVQRLAEFAPTAAHTRGDGGLTPLELALDEGHLEAARCLVRVGAAGPLLDTLAGYGEGAWPLYAEVARRCPLSDEQWAGLPDECPGLGAALPAVLARLVHEAGLLVGHLPLEDTERLQTLALCLARAQQRRGVPLPVELVWEVLGRAGAAL